MTTFTISGKPFAKQRPRMTRTGRAYTPKATVQFEAVVRSIAARHFPKPLDGPVSVEIWASFEPPKSWSKKKTAQHINRHHTQRPDLDNCMKAILDGLNRVAFADDAQVAEMQLRKVWGPTNGTVVTITPLQAVT